MQELAKFDAYRASKPLDPGYFWAVYLAARDRGEDLPPFVTAYIDAVAHRLVRIGDLHLDIELGGFEAAVAEALGYRRSPGRGTPASMAREASREHDVIALIAIYYAQHARPRWKDIDELVAIRAGMSLPSATKYRQSLMRNFLGIPEKLLREAAKAALRDESAKEILAVRLNGFSASRSEEDAIAASQVLTHVFRAITAELDARREPKLRI